MIVLIMYRLCERFIFKEKEHSYIYVRTRDIWSFNSKKDASSRGDFTRWTLHSFVASSAIQSFAVRNQPSRQFQTPKSQRFLARKFLHTHCLMFTMQARLCLGVLNPFLGLQTSPKRGILIRRFPHHGHHAPCKQHIQKKLLLNPRPQRFCKLL